MPRSLARRWSRAAASRTWATDPGADPSSSLHIDCTESTTHTSGASAAIVAHTVSRLVSASTPTPSTAPRRSARRRTCAGDSSPATSSTFARPARRASSAAVRLDLPMPGSPASSTSDPGTRPPPSTRSSSPMPGLQAVRMLERNLARAEPRRRRARGAATRPGACSLRRALLDERRPGLAAGAAAEPARLAATALTADEHGAGQSGHGRASLRWRPDGVERGAGQLWLGVATARYRCGCSTASSADSAEISHDCNSPSAPTTSRSSRPETSSQISRTSPPWEVVRDSSSRFMHTVVRQQAPIGWRCVMNLTKSYTPCRTL